MPRLELHPRSGLRGEAARLLADRHARQRAAEPRLPGEEQYEPRVDSRSVDPLATRFWSKRGFRPASLRRCRAVP